MKTIFPHRVVEMQNPASGNVFKVNGQRQKPFLKIFAKEEMVEELENPVYQDPTNS